MSEEVVNQEGQPAPSAEEVANQEALARLEQGSNQGMPEGLDANGDPIEEGLIDGKFNSQEDLLKAYKELEKKLGSQGQDAGEQPSKEDGLIPEDSSEEGEQPPQEALDAGLSPEAFNTYVDEFSTNGQLSEESYKALEAKGLTKDIVDNYIAGQQAILQGKIEKAQAIVGGQEAYNELIAWAVDNLSEAQKKDFNTKVMSGDDGVAKDAIEFLAYKRGQENPEVNRINGSGVSGNQAIKPFKTFSEYSQATAHREYGKNRTYTEMVDARFLKSKF